MKKNAESLRNSLEGHPKAALDEMQYLTEELLQLLHSCGSHTPTLDLLYQYYAPETSRIPDGSKNIPLNWKGVLIPGILILTWIILRKLKR